MPSKLLTIIVPCYNMEQYVEKCLDSLGIHELMGVLLPNGQIAAECLEVIVVNDGSTDNTSKIAHEYANHVNVKASSIIINVIDKANGHYGSCINVGVKTALGVYVRILEPDDTYDTSNFSDFLKYLYGLLDSNVDVVLSELARVGKDGKILSYSRHTLRQDQVYPISELVKTKGCVFNGGLTYRKNLLHEINYHQMEGVCYSDTQWYLVPLCHAKTLACFPSLIYKYFVERDGQSMNRVQYARNTWMMEKVSFDLLENYASNVKHADKDIARHVRRQIYECLLSIYVVCIIWREKKFSKTDLRVLDMRLRGVAPDIFNKIGEVKWSNSVLPYHYVRAWRRNSPTLPMMALMCRLYSSVVMFISRWRYRKLNYR